MINRECRQCKLSSGDECWANGNAILDVFGGQNAVAKRYIGDAAQVCGDFLKPHLGFHEAGSCLVACVKDVAQTGR